MIDENQIYIIREIEKQLRKLEYDDLLNNKKIISIWDLLADIKEGE